jgi:outer membrane protein assembly factor BamA
MRRVVVILAALVGTAPFARAAGEPAEGERAESPSRVIRVRVVDNSKTDPNTIQEIAGVSEGALVTQRDLDLFRARLLESGLFRDVDVTTERGPAGVTVVIAAQDRISWFIAPTFSYSADAYGGGVAFGETNLFGWQKKVVGYGALSNTTGTIVGAYLDPSIRGTWAYYQLEGFYLRDEVYEYAPAGVPRLGITYATVARITRIDSGGGGATFGVRWWRKLKTEGRLGVRHVRYLDPKYPQGVVPAPGFDLAPRGAGTDGTNFSGRVAGGWDSRATIHGVQSGLALLGAYEAGLTPLGGQFGYQKISANCLWALRFFKEHNLILRLSGFVTRDEPFFEEYESGGTGLRGYFARQFRGDTRLFGSAEYQFPIFRVWGLHLRGLGFYDSNLSWFSQPPTCSGAGPSTEGPCADGYPYAERRAGDGHVRYFLPGQEFTLDRGAWRNGVGGGVRFYLKTIAMPLVGVDYGYGLEDRQHQVYITVGGPL